MEFAQSAAAALQRISDAGERLAHSHPLRHQYAGHERARNVAQGEGGAARRSDHHDHRLWRCGNQAQGAGSAAPRRCSPSRSISWRCAARSKRGSRRPHDRTHPGRRRRAGPRGSRPAEVSPPDPRRRDRGFCSPATASRRSTALKANTDIDLVVTDINMPRMDGLSLLQKLQESEGGISTIIVSAYGDMANIRTAMNRGAFDFVTKPIDFADLETTIAKTLRHIEFLRDARRPPGRGRTRACVAVALLLAQSGAAARERRGRGRTRRAAPRDRDAVHRHRQLHRAG